MLSIWYWNVSSPSPFCILEIIDGTGFCRMIGQRSLDAPEAILAYLCSVEIDWKDFSCVGGCLIGVRKVIYEVTRTSAV